MSETHGERERDVMGGPGQPADVLAGGREAAGDEPDVMSSGDARPSDELAGGREAAGEDADTMAPDRVADTAADDPDVLGGAER